MKSKIISERAITTADVRVLLDKVKEKDGELNFRAGKTYDYLNQCAMLDAKAAKKLEETLAGLGVPRLKDAHIKKLVDVLPITSQDVKMVLQGYAVTVTEENLKKLAEALAEAAGKKKAE